MNDITDLFTELGIPYARHDESPHVSQGWVGLNCPWCPRGTENFGLGVNLRHGWCNCWACGRHSLSEALSMLSGVPEHAIRPRIAPGGWEPLEPLGTRRRGILVEPQGICWLPIHEEYLRGRGFNPDNVHRNYQVSGLGGDSPLGWRIYLPVVFGRRRVTWTTRVLVEGSGLRYRSAGAGQELVPVKHTLYNYDYVRSAAVVVEGPFDALRVGPGAVATFGVDYSPTQVALLARVPLRVVCFDREAQSQARRLCRELSHAPGRTVRAQLSGKDPDTSPPEEVAWLRREFLE